MQRITEYLEHDHERLHALLERSRAGATFDAEAFDQFRRGLLRHIGIEEKLLFPEVSQRLGRNMERIRDLRVEHAAITSLLVPTPDHSIANELAGLLGRHDQREEGETGVYAEAESVLGDASLALAEKAAAWPEVKVAKHYDGKGVKRTAAEALAAAENVSLPRVKVAEKVVSS